MLNNNLKFIVFFLIFLATTTNFQKCFVRSAEENDAASKSNVVELNDDNIEDVIKANKYVLIKFYAPWCKHCQAMAPEYKTAADLLKTNKIDVVLADYDCSKHTIASAKYGVSNYPTIYFFKNGVKEEYSAGRTSTQIVEWVMEAIQSPFREADDIFAHMLESKLDTALVFIAHSSNSKFYTIAFNVAHKMRFFVKSYIKFDESKPEKLLIRREGDEDIVYDGEISEEKLVNFIKKEAFSYLGKISEQNFQYYIERGLDLAWVCGEDAELTDLRPSIIEAAKSFKEKFSFVWLNTETFKEHATKVLGVTEFPGLVVQLKAGRYILPNAPQALKDKNKIISFFKDVEAGKIERFVKSQDIPEPSDDPVKIVVGKNLEKVVFQDNKDVLLMVYASWCGHCKKLEPVYTELAELCKPHSDKVIIAKMDGVNNESTVDLIEWTGFPTIFYFKAGQKEPMKYSGARELNDLINFLEKNSSRGLKIRDGSSSKDKSEEL